MPAKKVWTEADDDEIRQKIAAGQSTTQIARQFGCSRQCVLGHAKAIGVIRPRWGARPAAPTFNPRSETHAVVAYPRDIYPLPPGHDVTWQAITRGTCLEGQEYPR